MKGRDILKSMVSAGQAAGEAPAVSVSQKPAGAVRAMNLSLNRLNDEAAAAKVLRDALASGDKVVELDPDLIENSFIQDRIPVELDPELEKLKTAIDESGQQVPILVRPHPTKVNCYQSVFGHRRRRVAKLLGRRVKAIVREMTDEEVILAQGQENGPRVDLSFIERALFARRMHEHGFDRDTIAKALSVDKPEISRLLQVADAVKPELILAVGPAFKVGRPRWLAFADGLKDTDAAKRVDKELTSAEFAKADSNARFERLWKALAGRSEKKTNAVQVLRGQKGLPLASIERGTRGTKITVTSEPFAAFLSDKLADLVAAFEREKI